MEPDNMRTKSSGAEDDRYLVLKSDKNITCLKRQLLFKPIINNVEVFEYTADFAYVENGNKIIEEYKGHEFQRHDFRLRMRICSAMYPDLIFRIVKAKGVDTQYKAGKVFSRKPRKPGRPKLC